MIKSPACDISSPVSLTLTHLHVRCATNLVLDVDVDLWGGEQQLLEGAAIVDIPRVLIQKQLIEEPIPKQIRALLTGS